MWCRGQGQLLNLTRPEDQNEAKNAVPWPPPRPHEAWGPQTFFVIQLDWCLLAGASLAVARLLCVCWLDNPGNQTRLVKDARLSYGSLPWSCISRTGGQCGRYSIVGCQWTVNCLLASTGYQIDAVLKGLHSLISGLVGFMGNGDFWGLI